jgi:alpha-1,3-mannosylglycoprotein beta-1,4-N-acetylglucosaminyltransferase C
MDPEHTYNAALVSKVMRRFSFEVSIGFIHLYEPRVVASNHAMEVEAIKAMSNYASNLSTFYMHLDDDVDCAPSFYQKLKRFLTSRKMEIVTSWSLVEFSEMPLVGKLVKSTDLPKLAAYLDLFASDATDEMLSLFRHTMLQGRSIMLKPTLFQRYNAAPNANRDRFFDEGPVQGDDPEGTVLTNMEALGQNGPEFAYRGGQNMFWAKTVSAGDWLTVVLEEEAAIDRLLIQTGISDYEGQAETNAGYILNGAHVEVSSKLLRMDASSNKVTCANYRTIGTFTMGKFDVHGITESLHGKKTKCITVRASEDQPESVMFQRISVFLKAE